MKIVSLVPSLTELLFHLDLGDQIVGRTKFCIHPENQVSSIAKIGGTKNLNISKIIALQPDLVIANKEENTKEDVFNLQHSLNIHITEIANYEEALKSIKEIGHLTNRAIKAQQLVENIESGFKKIALSQSYSICYLIWNNPYMTIGKDTFIHDMLMQCGFKNCFSDRTRYPEVTEEEIKRANPDYIFLSTEPYPFNETHINRLRDKFPNSKIKLVDGEYFSWYGSRMLDASAYFSTLISKIEI